MTIRHVRLRISNSPPAAGHWNLCHGGTLADTSDYQSYSGTVYQKLNSYISLWVWLKNVNFLGWSGTVTITLDGVESSHHSNGIILPTNTQWFASVASYSVTNWGHPYTVVIDADSDATALAVQIWAPFCTKAGAQG